MTIPFKHCVRWRSINEPSIYISWRQSWNGSKQGRSAPICCPLSRRSHQRVLINGITNCCRVLSTPTPCNFLKVKGTANCLFQIFIWNSPWKEEAVWWWDSGSGRWSSHSHKVCRFCWLAGCVVVDLLSYLLTHCKDMQIAFGCPCEVCTRLSLRIDLETSWHLQDVLWPEPIREKNMLQPSAAKSWD